MPGLIGYMLAIVITLGGYFAALNWLIRPPDPWQSSAKIPASTAQHAAARKRPPVEKPAEAASAESTSPAEPDARLASVETSAPLAANENETTRPVEPTAVQARLPADATRAVVEAPHVARREASATKTRPGTHKRVERNTSRKLELMVLRTYERSDGVRFTRLLPLNSARNALRDALAFQPDDPW
jgi:cytoskeletal protein RodZ